MKQKANIYYVKDIMKSCMSPARL